MTKSADLLAAYPAAVNRFDELFEAPLRPRPHWSAMFSMMSSVGARQVGERLQSAERQIRERGVTDNVYADPQGLDRPWELDVLPMLIPHDEWNGIEAAIAQRARLLNLILADLYGPQVLLRAGLVQSELVFGHIGCVRADLRWGKRATVGGGAGRALLVSHRDPHSGASPAASPRWLSRQRPSPIPPAARRQAGGHRPEQRPPPPTTRA